jgi:hypothetical protein
VFDTPQLIQSLSAFAEERRSHALASPPTTPQLDRDSLVLLRVQAAASYFAANKTLMLFPPPVSVDIILDRYIANVFPASLVPTAVYILLLFIIAIPTSRWALEFLQPSSIVKQHHE